MFLASECYGYKCSWIFIESIIERSFPTSIPSELMSKFPMSDVSVNVEFVLEWVFKYLYNKNGYHFQDIIVKLY